MVGLDIIKEIEKTLVLQLCTIKIGGNIFPDSPITNKRKAQFDATIRNAEGLLISEPERSERCTWNRTR